MQRRINASGVWLTVSTAALVVLAGCGGANSGLPAMQTVTLPDGTEVVVTQGAGAASLADSTWQFFQTARNAQGAPFLTLKFGPNGELTRFEENTIAQEILGSTVIFDGATHPTGISGIQYAAATFGAESSDATGFTFDSVLTVTAPIVGEVASGTATATGTLDPEDSTVMTGTFSFDFTVSSLATSVLGDTISPEDLTGEFSFVANRLN